MLEDHYHHGLKSLSLFSRSMLHDMQHKKQSFWIRVQEAHHSGKKFSNAQLKIFHFG